MCLCGLLRLEVWGDHRHDNGIDRHMAKERVPPRRSKGQRRGQRKQGTPSPAANMCQSLHMLIRDDLVCLQTIKHDECPKVWVGVFYMVPTPYVSNVALACFLPRLVHAAWGTSPYDPRRASARTAGPPTARCLHHTFIIQSVCA